MHRSRNTLATWAVTAAGLVAGCSSAETPTAVTYHGAVRAVVETRCAGCHAAGGVAPFALTTFEEVKATAPAALAAVEAGRMPPWMPDPDCRRYQDERLIPAEEVATLRAWVEAGSPEGDPATYVPRQASLQRGLNLSDLGPPSAELTPREAYAPDSARPDDYRCFPLDHAFTEETYVRTTNIVPDQRALVHHVILYLVEPQFSEVVEQMDAADPGPGYQCFGGVGTGQPKPIGGWTPGDGYLIGSEDAGIRIPAGARLVLQMHYNTLAATPSPDRTMAQLWFLDERPAYLLEPRFFPHLGIDVPAGDAASTHARTFKNTSAAPWTIVATAPHMHLLGSRLRTVKVDAQGKETCLVDIPRWDFSWQQSYALRPGEELLVAPGESVRLECTYDNSAANQPVVNGERREPTRVTWGEGTLDEMCLNTIILLEPYAPLPDVSASCDGFQGCYDQCRTTNFPRTGCVLRCGASGCAQCVLPGYFSSVSDTCGVQANAVIECLESCDGAPDPSACVTNACGPLIVGFDACAGPHIEAGVADRSAAACGVEL